MPDKEIALELAKIVVKNDPTLYHSAAQVFDLYRQCLALVQEKPE